MVSLDKTSLTTWQDNGLEVLRYEYDLKQGDYVLDIGSYRREWGAKIEADYGCRVEYFEALDNRAAWIYDGEIELGGAYYYSSIFLPSVTRAKCEDIKRYLNQPIALMKINIEGGEYLLIDHIIESGLIVNINNLQVQFHLIEGQDSQRNYERIAARLAETHELTWRYPYCWENWKLKFNI